MAEADLMRLLQRCASSLGARLFRQNTGMAWVGNVTRNRDGSITIRNPRPFHAGVAGMSDLGGWVPVEVTADMVGSTVAVYCQVEVKENARATKEQSAWITAVNRAGGRAGIAHNESELTQIIRGNR